MILYETHIKSDPIVIDGIIKKLKTEKCFCEHSKHYTSFRSDLDEKPENVLTKKYAIILNNLVRDFGFYNVSQFYHVIWSQLYPPKTGKHDPHSHFNNYTLFSWVHFIRPTKEKHFYFLDSDNNKSYPDQEKDKFIVFPSWKRHGVDVNKTEEERFVIAGNLLVIDFDCNS